MSFITELTKRNFMNQCTDLVAFSELSNKQPVTAYIGFDCTAPSLHVGNLMQIMILRMLQRYGHKPIVIVGGATTKIGDPSGKDEARKMLSEDDILENMRGIKKSLSKFIRFDDTASGALMIDNSNWLEKLNYIEFLRDYGKLFSVNRMLTMESVKLRLDRQQPLSFLEFNYMLMQAYDFCHLNKEYNCSLQIGGSDQWGNIVMGIDLIHKVLGKQAFGITTPLLTTASGAKMGKSAQGAVWLNEELLSAYDYYQFWRNIEDADVVRFSKFYAEFSEEEGQQFEDQVKKDINGAKKRLAYRLTSMCHGETAAEDAEKTAVAVFESGGIGKDLLVIEIAKTNLASTSLVDALCLAGLSTSKSEARKLIRGGGARVNNEKILTEDYILQGQDINGEGLIKLSAGKKNHVAVKLI